MAARRVSIGVRQIPQIPQRDSSSPAAVSGFHVVFALNLVHVVQRGVSSTVYTAKLEKITTDFHPIWWKPNVKP